MVGGMLASSLGAGFLGGMVAGFLAGYTVSFLKENNKITKILSRVNASYNITGFIYISSRTCNGICYRKTCKCYKCSND